MFHLLILRLQNNFHEVPDSMPLTMGNEDQPTLSKQTSIYVAGKRAFCPKHASLPARLLAIGSPRFADWWLLVSPRMSMEKACFPQLDESGQ